MATATRKPTTPAESTTPVESDELISASDVKVASRGRKVELNPSLVALFEQMTSPDQAARLSTTFGSVDKAKRQGVSATIRKNWKAVKGADTPVKIDFGADGVPQVRFGKVKTDA